MIEIWKDVVGYEGAYQVSNLGRLRSVERIVRGRNKGTRVVEPKILKIRSFPNGYYGATLSTNSVHKTVLIHRLVAQAFIKKRPKYRNTVNHKNGNRADNRLVNLEWLSLSENQRYSFRVLGRKGYWFGKFGKDHHTSKPVHQIDIRTGKSIKYWENQTQAAKSLGFCRKKISAVCCGRRKTHAGFSWRFVKHDS